MTDFSTSDNPTKPSDTKHGEKKPSKLRSAGGALLGGMGMGVATICLLGVIASCSTTSYLKGVPHAAQDACRNAGGQVEDENLSYKIGTTNHTTGRMQFCLTKEGSMGEVWSPKIPLDGSMISAQEWTSEEVTFAKQCAKAGGVAYRTKARNDYGGPRSRSSILLNMATCIKDGYPIVSYNDIH